MKTFKTVSKTSKIQKLQTEINFLKEQLHFRNSLLAFSRFCQGFADSLSYYFETRIVQHRTIIIYGMPYLSSRSLGS